MGERNKGRYRIVYTPEEYGKRILKCSELG
jgi:hypothetical protein